MIDKQQTLALTFAATIIAGMMGCSYRPSQPLATSSSMPSNTTPTATPMGAASDTSIEGGQDSQFSPVKSYTDFQQPQQQQTARSTSKLGLFGELPGQSVTHSIDNSGNIRQVSFTREGSDFDADIDPQGNYLIYASTQHSTTSDIYMKHVNGSTVTTLTSDPADDVMPAFSPDGSKIAFASNRNGSWDIYVKPVGGGQAIQITTDPSHELHPSWSPDGQQIIFSSLGRTSGQWEIVLVDITQNANRRTLGLGLFPSFNPKGDKIVYQLASQRGTRRFSIWTMDLEDDEAMRPTEIAAALNAAVINPAWSPDGKQIAFATVVNTADLGVDNKPKESDLWLINVDGTGRVKLTSDDYANFQPVWARDQKTGANGTIYFVSNRTSHENIWAIRPNKRTMQVATGASADQDNTAQATVPAGP